MKTTILVTNTIENTKEIKISDIQKVLTRGYKDPNWTFSTQQRYEPIFKIAFELIKENRYEIFDTYEGYQIITNGYRALKGVEFLNSDRKSIPGREVINKLINILENK